ncbi:MAG: site-specific DNA-methyltransferase, partial [Gammaproteobacteria bacterium]|nr:site-specific DNA-methyltransferase [Gammaproteobacteria bacterium]
MPTLEFKGKQIIYAHHLTVPVRALDAHPAKSFPPQKSPPELDGNLIIHGDNLHALKALLPRYAGRVHCIYIDPPYNTGNEKWIYNDNVNSPQMRDWLKGKNPVDGEDLERHDKWLCMMWPRLHLLRELLAEDGVIFVSIDDNEQHRLRLVMDEIFGGENFVCTFVWNKKNVVQSDATFASVNHEYIFCYRKSELRERFNLLPRTEEANARYKNIDEDPRGAWQSVALQAKSGTSDMNYTVKFPNGIEWKPPTGTFPKFSKTRLLELYKEGRLWFGKNGKNVPRLKKYLSDVQSGMVANSLLTTDVVGSTQVATETLKSIMGGSVFSSPKSPALLQRLFSLVTDEDSIILDSFAGSATTAHAVLALNKSD